MQEEHRRVYARAALWSFVGGMVVIAVVVSGLAIASLQEERESEGDVRQISLRNMIASRGPQSPSNTSAADENAPVVSQGENERIEHAQIGLNFIRVLTDEADARVRRGRTAPRQASAEDITSPEWIFSDFSELGVQVYRQLTEADLSWANIEQVNDAWSFNAPDAVLPSLEYEPVVTLFSMQYASGAPPWATSSSEFEPRLGADAKNI